MKLWFSSKTYRLFNINNYKIDTSKFGSLLHDFENELEQKFASYVGAKYACIANSASSLLELCLAKVASVCPPHFLEVYKLELPSMIPIAVSNLVHNARIPSKWKDDVDWVGSSYVLYDTAKALSRFKNSIVPYKIIDSAQEVRRNQFAEDARDQDLMIFSLYPTKPVGGMDGGVMVSNDKEKIDYYRSITHLGVVSVNNNSWDRVLSMAGWKMHPNSSQCYVALKNLEKLDYKNEKLDEVKKKYNEAFEIENRSRHLYRITVDDKEEFTKNMTGLGIETGFHYGPAHLNPFYDIENTQPLTETLKLCTKTVSIPFHEMLSKKDIKFIIEKVNKYK